MELSFLTTDEDLGDYGITWKNKKDKITWVNTKNKTCWNISKTKMFIVSGICSIIVWCSWWDGNSNNAWNSWGDWDGDWTKVENPKESNIILDWSSKTFTWNTIENSNPNVIHVKKDGNVITISLIPWNDWPSEWWDICTIKIDSKKYNVNTKEGFPWSEEILSMIKKYIKDWTWGDLKIEDKLSEDWKIEFTQSMEFNNITEIKIPKESFLYWLDWTDLEYSFQYDSGKIVDWNIVLDYDWESECVDGTLIVKNKKTGLITYIDFRVNIEKNWTVNLSAKSEVVECEGNSSKTGKIPDWNENKIIRIINPKKHSNFATVTVNNKTWEITCTVESWNSGNFNYEYYFDPASWKEWKKWTQNKDSTITFNNMNNED